MFIFLLSCTSNNKIVEDKYFKELNQITSELEVKGKMSMDSAVKVLKQLSNLQTEEEKVKFVEQFKKILALPSVPKMSNDEYLKYYKDKYNSISLKKRFNVAPLYGQYADALSKLIAEIDEANRLYRILEDQRLKKLLQAIENKNKEALKNYLKFGEPDEDFIEINSSCEAALKDVLKDPDYELVKDKYYLKQSTSGYKYKLLIRAKNSFGAKVLQEMTFDLQYDPTNKMYTVVNVK